MRYFELFRNKYSNKIESLIEYSEKEYNAAKRSFEYRKEKLANDPDPKYDILRYEDERQSQYVEFVELEEESFECHCINYAIEYNKKYLKLKKDIKKLVLGD